MTISHLQPTVSIKPKLAYSNSKCAIKITNFLLLFKLVDPNSEFDVMNSGEHGEIWVRGPQVMKGYIGQPQSTQSAITEDGWFKTGEHIFLFNSIIDQVTLLTSLLNSSQLPRLPQVMLVTLTKTEIILLWTG